MTTGFHINLLRITGNQKKPQEISFGQGLNVISGASDTGKSFIFQCLDYMLGAQKIPKEIDEAKGYSIFELQITAASGNTYTLKRNWLGGKFSIKEGSIDSNAAEEEYAERLTDDPKNISTFLLGLCGFSGVELKKNQHEKVRLSFRDIAGLTLVDEKQIITEDSPVHSKGETIYRTREQSLFYYLLTGLDAKDFKEVEDPKTIKGKINGKIELIKELIEKTQDKLGDYKNQNVDDLTKIVNENIDSLSLEYSEQIKKIDELKTKRNQYHVQKTKKESMILFKKELLERFELLKKHYLSDLERLTFISEGNFLLNQLNSVSCPICGTALKDEHLNHLIKYEDENVLLEQASKSELRKISLKLEELTAAIETLKIEIKQNDDAVQKLAGRISTSDAELTRNLTPITATLKQRINSLFIEKQRLAEYNRLREQITSYQHQINDLNQQLKNRTKQNKGSLAINKGSLDRFCQIAEDTLRKWQFPGLTTVTFDTKHDTFDLIISGRKRSSHGKGIRAISYTAFLLSLLRYVYERNTPYSYNIVLDSPLTTFKDKDVSSESGDKISQETEDAFFNDLSNLPLGVQIIILDNKEPPLDLRDKITYHHFSGKEGVGRPGFFV